MLRKEEQQCDKRIKEKSIFDASKIIQCMELWRNSGYFGVGKPAVKDRILLAEGFELVVAIHSLAIKCKIELFKTFPQTSGFFFLDLEIIWEYYFVF